MARAINLLRGNLTSILRFNNPIHTYNFFPRLQYVLNLLHSRPEDHCFVLLLCFWWQNAPVSHFKLRCVALCWSTCFYLRFWVYSFNAGYINKFNARYKTSFSSLKVLATRLYEAYGYISSRKSKSLKSLLLQKNIFNRK